MAEHQEGPFFINLHYYTVHRPIHVRDKKLVRKYRDKPGDATMGQGMANGKEKVPEAPFAEERS